MGEGGGGACSLPQKKHSTPVANSVEDEALTSSLPNLLTCGLKLINKSTGLPSEDVQETTLRNVMGKECTLLYVVRRPG